MKAFLFSVCHSRKRRSLCFSSKRHEKSLSVLLFCNKKDNQRQHEREIKEKVNDDAKVSFLSVPSFISICKKRQSRVRTTTSWGRKEERFSRRHQRSQERQKRRRRETRGTWNGSPVFCTKMFLYSSFPFAVFNVQLFLSVQEAVKQMILLRFFCPHGWLFVDADSSNVKKSGDGGGNRGGKSRTWKSKRKERISRLLRSWWTRRETARQAEVHHRHPHLLIQRSIWDREKQMESGHHHRHHHQHRLWQSYSSVLLEIWCWTCPLPRDLDSKNCLLYMSFSLSHLCVVIVSRESEIR